MKYTIPYDDKITLPHIKKLESIGINADKLNYDSKELTGEVLITGDYLLDNSHDVMEFKHDIPVSFLIDDEKISPEVHISNFKYELIHGRGIEVMFDLDVILTEQEEEETIVARNDEEDKDMKEFQEKIDENLDSVLKIREKNNEKKKENKEVDREERPIFKTKKDKKEVEEKHKKITEEDIEEELEETPLEQAKEEGHKLTKKTLQEELEETPLEQVLEETYGEELDEEDIFNAYMKSTPTSFDTGFIPRDHDKFTTYKILLVENNESVDDVLEKRNLSKAFVCKEYQFDNQKIVLKLEDD